MGYTKPETRKKWKENNPEKVKESCRKNYQKNKEKIKSVSKAWAISNPEKKVETDKAYYEKNKEMLICKSKDYNKANPDVNRSAQYKRKYGITLEDYNKMFNEQEGKCFTCLKHQSEFKQNLVIDHNHETGKVRGLLCHNCNRVLGLIKENQQTLANMIEYLK